MLVATTRPLFFLVDLPGSDWAICHRSMEMEVWSDNSVFLLEVGREGGVMEVRGICGEV
jgi:hypothetical protein